MIGQRIRAACAASALTFVTCVGSGAGAQSLTLPTAANLNDTNCYGVGFLVGSYCMATGTRTVATISQTTSSNGPFGPYLTGTYDVHSSGYMLSNDGLTSVIAQTAYTGLYDNYFVNSVELAQANGRPLADFQSFRDISATISSIDFKYNDAGTVTISTPSPTTLIGGNSVNVSGLYRASPANGYGIIFGTIGGTVTATPNAGVPFGGPLTLTYDLVQTAATQLDATGLITPRIQVSDGIAMGGSKLTGLAAGTDGTDAVNKAQLDGEAAARTAAVGSLSGQITQEAASRANADTALGGRIDGETAARTSAQGTLASQIAQETTARTAGETATSGQIASEATTRAAGDSALGGRIDQEAAARAAAVADLAARLANAGGGSAAVAALGSRVDDETGARAAGDSALATSIGNESKLRTDGDAQLAASVDAEAQSRATGDQKLATAVASEADTRGKADGALATAITYEGQTRAQADSQLAGAIGGEAAARAQQDTQLNQRIDAGAANQAALANALVSETSARQAADLALSTKVDTLSGRLDQIDGRLDRLDRRMSSATAVAVALGGNAFLPDMKFNLTANVGTYDGAHAGAVQVGALVSRHVALNGGVATGFNRGGGTAARAGVTLGW